MKYQYENPLTAITLAIAALYALAQDATCDLKIPDPSSAERMSQKS